MSEPVWADPGRFVCPECRRTVTRDEPAWIEDGAGIVVQLKVEPTVGVDPGQIVCGRWLTS